jgi:hypothetical protein
MTNKQKFNQIDQTKLSDAQKGILSQIKDKTNNFTSKDKDLNAKISTSLDTIISKLKEKTPEALKTTSKAPKRTAMGLAKDIRKADESWNDALVRARKQMKADGESATKIMKSEIEKLKTFIKNHKELEGLRGTDLPRDSVRRAKPKGRRVSKNGNVYYEYRDNRTDRLAPNYPKGFPKLENGGDFMSGAYAEDGMMLGNSNGMEEDIDLSDDNKMRIKDMDYKYNRKSAREIAEKHNAAAFEYMNEDEKRFALGGVFSNNFTGETGTHYTGLVGETNALSSGELFENGGFMDGVYERGATIGNKKIIVETYNGKIEYNNKDIQEMLDDIDMYISADNLPSWLLKAGKYKVPGFPKNKQEVIKVLNQIKNYKNDVYINVNSKEPLYKYIIKYHNGGLMDGVYAESGAMIANQQLIKDATMNPAKMFANEGIPAYVPVYKRGGMMKYHEGGNLYQHGLDEGDTIVKSFGKYQKVKDANGKIVFVNLATGMRTKMEPK